MLRGPHLARARETAGLTAKTTLPISSQTLLMGIVAIFLSLLSISYTDWHTQTKTPWLAVCLSIQVQDPTLEGTWASTISPRSRLPKHEQAGLREESFTLLSLANQLM